MAGKAVYGSKMNTPVSLLDWVFAFEKPKPGDDGKEKPYGVVFWVPKTADISAIRAEAERVAREAFGKRFVSLDKLKNNPFRDGDDFRDKEGSPIPHTQGKVRISATTWKDGGFPVVNARRIPITKKAVAEDGIYSGAWGIGNITPATYEKDGNWGVKFYINALQKVKDGEPLATGGMVDPDSVFQEFADENPSITSRDENF